MREAFNAFTGISKGVPEIFNYNTFLRDQKFYIRGLFSVQASPSVYEVEEYQCLMSSSRIHEWIRLITAQ